MCASVPPRGRRLALVDTALVAASVLFVARAILASVAGQPPSGGAALVQWAHDHRLALALANECLVIGAVALVPGIFSLFEDLRHRSSSGAAGCIVLLLSVPVMVTSGVFQGRLVYPVFDIPLDQSSSELAASLYYGGEHVVLLMIAAAAVLVSLSMPSRWMRFLGLCAAAASVAASYPAAIGDIASLLAHTLLGVWIFALSRTLYDWRRGEC